MGRDHMGDRGEVGTVEAGTDLKDAIARAVAAVGGFGAFVKPGARVLLKPNFNTADAYPGSSDPAAVAATADLLHEAGASEVTIADSSTFTADTTEVMGKLGIFGLAEGRPWLKVLDLNRGEWVGRDVPGGKWLKCVTVPKILSEVDATVFLCCLKTHFLAEYTGALKLAVGLMARRERLGLHFSRLGEKIGELASVVKPDITIMDARKCFTTGGPGKGTVREPGLVLASRDRVALDLEGVRTIQRFEGNSLAGKAPESVPHIKRAIEMGVDARS